MSFGNIFTNTCLATLPPPDTRCSDLAFALANPDICPVAPTLTVKPAFVLGCTLGSVQFNATYVNNGVETDVTNEVVWLSSDQTIAVVGAESGNATGLSPGEAIISATYEGLTAHSELTILAGDCDSVCEDQTVALMAVVDKTKSMSQSFGGAYTTKLAYAKAAAAQFISEINESKDTIGLLSFTDYDYTLHSPPIADKTVVGAMLTTITQTQQLTTFYDALSAAVDALAAVATDRKVIVLFSDGEDTDTSYSTADNPITLLSTFKANGGIVICLGVRAHGASYALLSAFSTGGFFINAHTAVAADSLTYLSGLKGYICAGNCVPTGDAYEATGQFNYAGFANWAVVDGHVDLIGAGFMDLLPGNGLYVDMAGNSSAYTGKLVSKTGIAVTAGDVYRMTVKLAGNQRVNLSPNRVRVQVFERNTDGLADPTIAPTLAVNTVGGPTDAETYRYAYSYQNANGETNLSPSDTATIANEGDTIDVVIPVSATATVVRLWRTTGDVPDSRYYLIATILTPLTPDTTDTYHLDTITAAIASGAVDASIMPPESNTTGTPIYLINQQIVIDNFQQEFVDYAFSATAPNTGTVFMAIQQTATPAGFDDIGLLLDTVTFENATLLELLFEDDFDDENVVYVEPMCGPSSYIPGYYGYSCYGDGCLLTPPPTQVQDPDPLALLESGYVPPGMYTSTKEACATCTAGFSHYDNISSGPESVDPGQPNYREYNWALAAGKIPAGLWLAISFSPGQLTYNFYGGNVSLAGNHLGTLLGSGSEFNPAVLRFDVPNALGFRYFRLEVTVGLNSENIGIPILLVNPTSQTQCATATATSEVSKTQADSLALQAAELLAADKLNCIATYSYTANYTAKCTVGFGPDKTRSATATSIVSLLEAKQRAEDLAQAAAEAALDCTGSNNTQRITINDRVGASAAKATPYPSVKYVEGLSGLITKVTITLDLFSHGDYADVAMLLVSPAGSQVYLMGNCMNGNLGETTERIITLDDDAASSMPQFSRPAGVTHTFKPTVYVTQIVPFPTPAPAATGPTYPTTLAEFIGEDPNGAWSLYVVDDTTLYSGYIDHGWDLTITTT